MSSIFSPKLFFHIFCFFLLFKSPSISQTQVLDHLEVFLEAGTILPSGKLTKYFDPSPQFGISVKTPYFKPLNSLVKIQYSLLKGSGSNSRSIHHVKSGIGLEYFPKRFWPSLGFGVSHYFLRTHEINSGPELLLDSNESEFGFFPFIKWGIYLNTKISIHLGIDGDMVFSSPDFTFLPNGSLSIGWLCF